ncbi:MAG: amidase family protein [Gammaproteobacteria bacterium]|nr:amidase family protein [Gammaproteobacteria bacterium]
MSNTLWRLGAVDIAAGIREGRFSCIEVMEAQIARLHEANPWVNAITVDLSEGALDAASEADAAVHAGHALGPLHGVPVTIKENVDQEGQATTNGVAALAEVLATENAPVVDNLIKAGAIVIGRTNTPEFSLRWFTSNPWRGDTLNPWNEKKTPGGSSGGAAAGAALGLGAIAHGNDLGGSLRYPAYCCGLATIRPSLGRIPAYNASAVAERPPSMQLMSVQGPIAREVKDLRLALSAMARADSRDPWWVPAPNLGTDDGTLPRVAYCPDPAGDGVDPFVARAVVQAAQILAEAGYAVEEATPPLVREIAQEWGTLLFTEIEHMLAPVIREHGSADLLRVLELSEAAYPSTDLDGYLRTLAQRTGRIRSWCAFLEQYPLVLLPVSGEPPFGADEDLAGAERMSEIQAAQRTLVVANYLGLPAAVVPTGIHDDMPMGVQIIGARFREDLCLDAAERIEAASGMLSERLWSSEDEV